MPGQTPHCAPVPPQLQDGRGGGFGGQQCHGEGTAQPTLSPAASPRHRRRGPDLAGGEEGAPSGGKTAQKANHRGKLQNGQFLTQVIHLEMTAQESPTTDELDYSHH